MGIESSRLRLFANSNKVQNATGLAALLESLDVFDLMDQYHEVRELAPRRGRDGLKYFVDRIDHPVSRDKPGIAEDLLEMALVNDAATVEVNSGPVDVLMRQFPLIGKGSRRGVKAVDLVGHGNDRSGRSMPPHVIIDEIAQRQLPAANRQAAIDLCCHQSYA